MNFWPESNLHFQITVLQNTYGSWNMKSISEINCFFVFFLSFVIGGCFSHWHKMWEIVSFLGFPPLPEWRLQGWGAPPEHPSFQDQLSFYPVPVRIPERMILFESCHCHEHILLIMLDRFYVSFSRPSSQFYVRF